MSDDLQLDYTSYAENMLQERLIERSRVRRTISKPDSIETRDDGTKHYLKQISENGGRILRVVTHAEPQPVRIITVFFDRRARRKG